VAASDKLQDSLNYPPRGLRSPRAAAYVGVSEREFLNLVKEGVMPKPKRVKGMNIWDRFEIDAAFECLKHEDGPQRRNMINQMLGIDDK